MPYVRKKKTTKKPVANYAKNRNKIYRIPNTKMLGKNLTNVVVGLGFPKKLTMTHRYAQTIQITSTTGTMENERWSCNSLNDPYQSGGGQQPLYYDQVSALYDHYTVIGSKATFKVMNVSETTGLIGCGCFINDDTTVVPTTLAGMIEQSLNAKPPAYIANNASNPVTIVAKWSAKKTFGGSILGNDELKGTPTTNPTEQSYFNFYVQALDGVSTVSVRVMVLVEYTAVWRELKDIARS